jgi:hypothetical protein
VRQPWWIVERCKRAGERDPRHGGIVLWAERSASMLFNGAMGSLEPG